MPKTETTKHATKFKLLQIAVVLLIYFYWTPLKPHEYSQSNSGPGRAGLLVPTITTATGRSAELKHLPDLNNSPTYKPAASLMFSAFYPVCFSIKTKVAKLGASRCWTSRLTQLNNYKEKLLISRALASAQIWNFFHQNLSDYWPTGKLATGFNPFRNQI